MNKEKQHEHVKHVKEWKGYDMNALEQCRLVNSVKCELIKEQMAVVYRSAVPGVQGVPDSFLPAGAGFNKIMNYASYGIQAYKYVKAIVNLYRSLKAN